MKFAANLILKGHQFFYSPCTLFKHQVKYELREAEKEYITNPIFKKRTLMIRDFGLFM